MTKGIIIIAIGKKLYGNMAVVLAASIKAKSKLPILLIHDGVAIKDLPEEYLYVFDHLYWHNTDGAMTSSQQAFKLKTQLYELSPFDRTLFIDADCIICPGKSVDSWFDELDIDFTTYTNGYYDYASGKHARSDYTYWAEPEEVKKYFGIDSRAKLPQTNSSFIYFRKSDRAAELFKVAKEVWDDTGFVSSEYRNAKPDEFCFNVAVAITGVLQHRFPYRPVYFHFQSEQLSEPYIIDNFNAMSIISDVKADVRIEEMYNKWVDYYMDMFGMQKRYYYRPKTDKEARKVFGFYHVGMTGNWVDVVSEQVSILKYDGLLNATEKIFVSCTGTAQDKEHLSSLLATISDKFEIKIHNTSMRVFDFAGIQLIEDYVRMNAADIYGYFFHSKGVTKPDSLHKAHWRDLLNHYTLVLWERCMNKIRFGGYDVVGPNWKDENAIHERHFSGNFYWFDSQYIRRLPAINTLNRFNRFQAEMWIGKANPAAYCIAYHTANDEFMEWFPKRKIAIFFQCLTDRPTDKVELLRRATLLDEAHHSIAIIDRNAAGYDTQGFMLIGSELDINLRTYCLRHPDAYVLLSTNEIDDAALISKWRQCYELLEKGYDTVGTKDSFDKGEMWVRASFINTIADDVAISNIYQRKFTLWS